MDAALFAKRFWHRVLKTSGDGCWLWTGGVDGPKNYGKTYIGMSASGRRNSYERSHRVAWRLVYGPTKLHVLHRCDNPLCVRPSHLFVGTNADNVADRHAKGRDHKPTHCAKGHAYDADNTIFIPRGRACKACRKAWSRNTRLRRAAGKLLPAGRRPKKGSYASLSLS